MLVTTILIVSCSSPQKKQFDAETMSEKLQTPTGDEVTFDAILNKHKGKTTVIEFWASWCSDCVKAMPKLHEMQAAHPEVDYVFISVDKTAEKWKSGIEKHNIKGDHYLVADPLGMKGSFGKSVDLDWIPRYMILDKDGNIVVYRAIETEFESIDKTLNSLK